MKTLIYTLVTTLLMSSPATRARGETNYDQPVEIDLTFAYHIDADMAEQDVYIERPAGSDSVFRATRGDRSLRQPIFASAEPQAHAFFDPTATGPYPKGPSLGMTLGQWFGASGAGSYDCRDGLATIEVEFSGLVPEGVYTMWHFFMASPPTDPFIGTYDLPLGRRDGTDSVFKADQQGTAHYERTFKPCLQLSGEHLMSGLAVAWHSDGRTHGVRPGDFGLNSHVQMFLGLPKRSGI